MVEVCDRAGVEDMMVDDDRDVLARTDCAIVVYRANDAHSLERALHLVAQANHANCPAVLVCNVMDDTLHRSQDPAEDCRCPDTTLISDTPHFTCAINAPACRNTTAAFEEALRRALQHEDKPNRFKLFVRRIKRSIFRPVSPPTSAIATSASAAGPAFAMVPSTHIAIV